MHLETTDPTPSSVSFLVNTTTVNDSALLVPNTNMSVVSPFLLGRLIICFCGGGSGRGWEVSPRSVWALRMMLSSL